VPFDAFGYAEDDGWMRLSVGAVSMAQIEAMMPRVREALGREQGTGNREQGTGNRGTR
jgi:aspartate aminotransferase